MLTNPVWWFYNNWVPSFLFSKYLVNLMALGLPLVVTYLMTDVGSIFGGWVSGRFIKAGFGVFTSRKLALLGCALCTVPGFLAPEADLIWVSVSLTGLAMAAHQGFSAIVGRLLDATHNNYTLLFFIGAAAYVVATLAIRFLLPRHRADLIGSMAAAE